MPLNIRVQEEKNKDLIPFKILATASFASGGRTELKC